MSQPRFKLFKSHGTTKNCVVIRVALIQELAEQTHCEFPVLFRRISISPDDVYHRALLAADTLQGNLKRAGVRGHAIPARPKANHSHWPPVILLNPAAAGL